MEEVIKYNGITLVKEEMPIENVDIKNYCDDCFLNKKGCTYYPCISRDEHGEIIKWYIYKIKK